jgi:dTMP kinase
MNGPQGRFITIEGIDGAGKSTHVEAVVECLRSRNPETVVTREPGGTTLGERLRSLLLHQDDVPICPDAEALIVFTARAQHLHDVVRPHLASGRWVVCDRFTDATYAYQGGGRRMSPDRIRLLEQWVQNCLRPDLTLLLDLPVPQARSRLRAAGTDRFERTDDSFLERVRDAYLDIARSEPNRVRVVDAGQSPEHVREAVEATVADFVRSAQSS